MMQYFKSTCTNNRFIDHQLVYIAKAPLICIKKMKDLQNAYLFLILRRNNKISLPFDSTCKVLIEKLLKVNA